ncbi:MAG: hypothetical protein GF311_18255 [Candidatus Lokiarchaeota archaeon]|nr:hypothetical protein [Candidatus Lokiarchaeota archaeon]
MNYCPICHNLLVPRDNHLHCRVCDKDYELYKDEEGEYTNVRRFGAEKNVEAPVVEKDLEESISKRDRESHEEFFGTVEK